MGRADLLLHLAGLSTWRPRVDEAAEWALAFGQFHWGLTPWAFYCLPGLPIAYSMYVKKRDGVRLSVASRGVLGRHADGAWGVLLDSIVVFGIVGGVGTSLGLAVPLVSQLVSGICWALRPTSDWKSGGTAASGRRCSRPVSGSAWPRASRFCRTST
ncbi:BCCT family transporter [Cobetia sp. ICG0124]|uniref:BCCT family transporter n=1 Tax=Cobetia sp. ICG0124 TaxID=2053669 RepID=UPI00196A594E|nr:BCCT family transporter [Cobetia sp. ICG0124]